tara:strand:- start:5284 stop:5670 length:387 start_codon:yes stop_codon:yes gene_type:complete
MMIETLIGKTIVLLNNVQMAHWQTTSYAQHEALGEFYNKMNELNDKLVETWQGNQNKRIHIESGQNTIQNFTDIEHTNSEIVQYGQDIAQTSYDISQKNDMRQFEDIKAVLEEMAQQVSQTLYLLSLK